MSSISVVMSYLFCEINCIKYTWQNQFANIVQATGVGKLTNKRIVSLIGCCAEGDERLLVAEYTPNDTLITSLSLETQPLPWKIPV
ncbi:unnamed protein product [Brassica napus]|uniref:Serine/threonine-protein kinase BSK n=1 Tax=Brassica napus TaxID=3708 RepID=A0A816J6N7_BRANA|nr:unnamed protein product [Brassica napus]